MPSGLFDIRDRDEVHSPDEIEAGYRQCVANDIHYLAVTPEPNGPVIPLAQFVKTLKARWQRAAQTAAAIDAIKAGYCSIEPKTAPPRSDARH